ncbi:protein prenyltransferase alpha subunit repeat-containing protein [Phanerochaete sordida]|uniref:Protein prenyltransferase alpha subunit repeat-containing protein n=1 Tax=Phanerochaete sordida TaxID=48140 RepID=A0A9P3GAL8_9APHY|nr:protein prenyltransferase alpha subunit repeat-containing protein [Phanerochaete sordida]
MGTATRLGSALNGPLVSVEMLPGDGKEWLVLDPSISEPPQEFLLMEGNLGIPHKILYKAYLEASLLFKTARLALRSTTRSIDPSLAETVAQATAVIIVANPGHQTAWNARKRLLESGLLDPQRELSFTHALLTVRYCAKHSLLWHHRRWLLRRLCPTRPAASDAPPSTDGAPDEDTLQHLDISPTQLRAELDACTRAATTYERNYFAWAHRARCLDALAHCLREGAVRGFQDVLRDETANVRLWIDRHVGDYTAMQYYCRLVLLARSPDSPSPPTSLSAYQHAKALVEAYPEHESLWCYLRSAASVEGVSGGDIRPFVEKVSQGTEVNPATQTSLRHANSCLHWLRRQSPGS